MYYCDVTSWKKCHPRERKLCAPHAEGNRVYNSTTECQMSFEYNCNVVGDMNQLYTLVKNHVILYSPPWSLDQLLQPFISPRGNPVKIVIENCSRDVTLTCSSQSIVRQILQPTVQTFQNHRLLPKPRRIPTAQRRIPTAQRRVPIVQRRMPTVQRQIPTVQRRVPTLPCAHSSDGYGCNNTCPICRTNR